MLMEEYRKVLENLSNAASELVELKCKTQGWAVKNPAARVEADRLVGELVPLGEMAALTGERRAVAALDTMLLARWVTVTDIIGGDIKSIHPEFSINGKWRVDRAVKHHDGRITLIEVKDCFSPQNVAAGIGQVLYYKAMLERTSSHDPIVPALAVLQDPHPDISRACECAGVLYIPMGTVPVMRGMSAIVKIILGCYAR